MAALLLALVAGCVSDPASQRRIQRRAEAQAATIQGIKEAEARRPIKIQRRTDDLRRNDARKVIDFRESCRLAGDRFW